MSPLSLKKHTTLLYLHVLAVMGLMSVFFTKQEVDLGPAKQAHTKKFHETGKKQLTKEKEKVVNRCSAMVVMMFCFSHDLIRPVPPLEKNSNKAYRESHTHTHTNRNSFKCSIHTDHRQTVFSCSHSRAKDNGKD